MSRADRAVAAIVTLLLTGACAQAPDSSARAEPVRRDSAGIEILEYSRAAIEAAPLLVRGDTPDLSIGVAEGEEPYLFSRISAAAELSDGSIVIVDRSDLALRFFTPEGRYSHSAGRKGEGSGEFIRADGWWLGAADTLRVWGPGLSRLSTLADRGGSITSLQVSAASPGYNYYLGSYGDGWHLFWRQRVERSATYARMHTFLRMRPGRAGETWAEDTIYSPPPYPLILASQGVMIPVLWTSSPAGAMHPQGLWYTSSADPELHVIDTHGITRRIVRWQQMDRTVTPDHIETYIEQRLDEVPPEAAEETRREIEEMRKAERFPSIVMIMSKYDGRVWAVRFERPGEDVRGETLVFDPDGRLEVRIEGVDWIEPLPAKLESVLIAEEDSLGVPRVSRYRLVRAER